MDVAIHEHHACVRKLIYSNAGWESATEGDSFIIAFWESSDALSFCIQLQQALLPWPKELLETSFCEPVWARRVPAHEEHQATAALTRSKTSSFQNGRWGDAGPPHCSSFWAKLRFPAALCGAPPVWEERPSLNPTEVTGKGLSRELSRGVWQLPGGWQVRGTSLLPSSRRIQLCSVEGPLAKGDGSPPGHHPPPITTGDKLRSPPATAAAEVFAAAGGTPAAAGGVGTAAADADAAAAAAEADATEAVAEASRLAEVPSTMAGLLCPAPASFTEPGSVTSEGGRVVRAPGKSRFSSTNSEGCCPAAVEAEAEVPLYIISPSVRSPGGGGGGGGGGGSEGGTATPPLRASDSGQLVSCSQWFPAPPLQGREPPTDPPADPQLLTQRSLISEVPDYSAQLAFASSAYAGRARSEPGDDDREPETLLLRGLSGAGSMFSLSMPSSPGQEQQHPGSRLSLRMPARTASQQQQHQQYGTPFSASDSTILATAGPQPAALYPDRGPLQQLFLQQQYPGQQQKQQHQQQHQQQQQQQLQQQQLQRRFAQQNFVHQHQQQQQHSAQLREQRHPRTDANVSTAETEIRLVPLAVEGAGGSVTVGALLSSKWQMVDRRPTADGSVRTSQRSSARDREEEQLGVLLFRGLRVRAGVHSGLQLHSEGRVNTVSGRMQYTGALVHTAKAVCDAAHGGTVLLSDSTVQGLGAMPKNVLLLHVGQHLLHQSLPLMSLYQVVPRALEGRLMIHMPVRSIKCTELSVYDAPGVAVACAFCHVVGAANLPPELASVALDMFRCRAALLLIEYSGYLVEGPDGLLLASFHHPLAAMRWALHCMKDMRTLPWPEELLQHELCEEVSVTSVNAAGETVETVVFRGLRLKVGIEFGRIHGEINCCSGRMSYRGKVMNRASRFATHAATGQILTSAGAWEMCSPLAGSTANVNPLTGLGRSRGVPVSSVVAESLGQVALKGVSDLLEIYNVRASSQGLMCRRPTAKAHDLHPETAVQSSHSSHRSAADADGGRGHPPRPSQLAHARLNTGELDEPASAPPTVRHSRPRKASVEGHHQRGGRVFGGWHGEGTGNENGYDEWGVGGGGGGGGAEDVGTSSGWRQVRAREPQGAVGSAAAAGGRSAPRSVGSVVCTLRRSLLFGLTHGTGDKVDLSCVCFDIDGKLIDTVHAGKHTALEGAIISNLDPAQLPEELVPSRGDDVIHVFPKKFERTVEVLMLVASAPKPPGAAYDLSFPKELVFTVTYTDLSGNVIVKEIDCKLFLASDAQPEAEGAAPERPGSLLIATVYLDESGWTIRSVMKPFPYDNFGLIIPEMKQAIVDIKTVLGVQLDAANRLLVDDNERAVATRHGEDSAIDEVASRRQPAPVHVRKLRLDVGWATYPPTKNEEGEDEELEETDVSFSMVFYNLEGEEVFSVSADNPEGEGVKVGREAEEEPEQAEPPPPEEEGDGEEEGEEMGEGERVEAVPPPPVPKEDPYAFPARDVIFISLEELPKEARVALLVVNNFAGAGFLNVRVARARLLDATDGDQGATLLADFGIQSKFGADKPMTAVALFKLYKEYEDGAYSMFGSSGKANLASFVDGGDAVTGALKTYLDAQKQAQAKQDAAVAAAEESGEDITVDVRPFQWRYCALGLSMQGESLEAADHDIRNAISFDGPLAAGSARAATSARVQFPNADSYFGGYLDDLKEGPGIYTFATGAAHVGMYGKGKRDGRGHMILPDGGAYEGEFAADKYHGQGQYRYPDGSVYTGSWAAGQKHGAGVYWDTSGGCQRGSWVRGVLSGQAQYDQPAYHFTGNFVRGVPCGPATFSICPHRSLNMPKFAAAHIIADSGPTLTVTAEYSIPPGSEAEPPLDEEGNAVVDEDAAQLPSFPKYLGLGFTTVALPLGAEADVSFPPEQAGPVPLPKVPTFSVAAGLRGEVETAPVKVA
ncbi:MAG: hypothetical protein WDW36_004810 [Sanguina aurantia]